MKYPEIKMKTDIALELEQFKEMDYYAVVNYNLPIELMMENAGLQLASFVAHYSELGKNIRIGIGNGNNGGGGLVAARRLSAWGYNVSLDLITNITKDLPSIQLQRALKFGASIYKNEDFDVWIDAYLGFSQRFPLPENLVANINESEKSSALKISLDIPTGYIGNSSVPYFKSDKVLTLASPKRILNRLVNSTEIYVADLGIPKEVYSKFGVEILPFHTSPIIKLKN